MSYLSATATNSVWCLQQRVQHEYYLQLYIDSRTDRLHPHQRGAASTTSTNVTLTLSAEDSQTGVSQMRFGNSGEPWSLGTYGTSKAWTLQAATAPRRSMCSFKTMPV